MAFFNCLVLIQENGDEDYVAFALEEDKKSTLLPECPTLLTVHPDGSKTDHRIHPPFLPMIPCPLCGTTSDRHHDPEAHSYRGTSPRGNFIVGEHLVRIDNSHRKGGT